MIPIRNLFEAHVTVSDLRRSMSFYGDLLGLELAHVLEDRKVAFYWIGERGMAMLGIWEVGTTPQRFSLHLAFKVEVRDLLDAAQHLESQAIAPLDFSGNPTDQPVVLAWMPSAALYFLDPDGNLLEFLAMLPDRPAPEVGVVTWSAWMNRSRV